MPKSRSRRSTQRRPPARRPGQQRPAPQVPTVTAPGVRGSVERVSSPILVWLSARPKVLLPLLSLGLLVGGFLAPVPVAVPLLLLLLLVVGWLTYLSWPAVQGGGRVVRVATLALLLVALVTKTTSG